MQNVQRNRTGERLDRLASRMGPWISRLPTLRHILRRIRARLPAARTTPTTRLMEAFGVAFPRAFFIQIGANDGSTSDPLRRQVVARAWRGIMVEPVPHIFEKLRARYSGSPHVLLENVAIGASDGTAEFHSLVPVVNPVALGLPHWYAGLGSFRREVILSHKAQIPDIEQRIVTQTLPCLTFATLCARHGVDAVDLIQIDTEGYDYEVVKLIDLNRFRPALLIYEHVHLSAEDRAACENLLRRHGYEVGQFHLDTLALRAGDLEASKPALVHAWRSCFPAAGGASA